LRKTCKKNGHQSRENPLPVGESRVRGRRKLADFPGYEILKGM
jgi:hypothetical protein